MIHFLTPWALAGLALVPAAWYVGMRSRRLAPRRRRASVVLRAVVLTAVVVALARPRLVRNVDRTATAFLVDLSASVPAQERGRSEEFIKAALGKAGPRDVAAVVAFGEEALVDRSARQGPLEPIRSVPGTGRTDIGAALRLGLAILPSDAGRRLVLLSDGRDNTGDLDRHTDLLSASRVAVDLMPLAAASAANETLVKRLEAPTSSRVGQSFDLTAVIHAEVAGPAGVTISDGTKTIYDEEVALAPGDTQIRVPVTVEAEGFRRYRVRVYPEADSRRQNNVGEAFT
ncbi:MAG: vWA domain-containing protein, partial [Anaerolineae bacterium]